MKSKSGLVKLKIDGEVEKKKGGVKIISVSGSYSGVGKTHIITELLRRLKNWSCVKVTVSYKGSCGRGRPCGVCSSSKRRYSIITDEGILSERGKDTRRFKEAGAKEVMWLLAAPSGLRDGIKEVLSKFKKGKGLIIEGTRVLRYINPYLAIFVVGKERRMKPSARLALKKADVILSQKSKVKMQNHNLKFKTFEFLIVVFTFSFLILSYLC